MNCDRAMEISARFQEAYDVLLRDNGRELEERARPFLGFINMVTQRENCSSVEAVLIILKNWNNSTRIPMSALGLWLMASAVIIEKKEGVPQCRRR